MNQLDLFDAPIPNPCAGVCTVDERGLCKGCMRKREERFQWNEFSNTEKLHVIQLCKQRYRRKIRLLREAKAQQQAASQAPEPDLFTE
ncbi:DUF1289 domain-containing protein [Pokkaliibacter sp. CJK22405]|uniref:DUF1289 domain-containing protein n=1 Tax=Pokkaliibacter sp. CJK22405 TaxID=3384615 RepID=UPI003984E0F6